jgi:hypothetical protein
MTVKITVRTTEPTIEMGRPTKYFSAKRIPTKIASCKNIFIEKFSFPQSYDPVVPWAKGEAYKSPLSVRNGPISTTMVNRQALSAR